MRNSFRSLMSDIYPNAVPLPHGGHGNLPLGLGLWEYSGVGGRSVREVAATMHTLTERGIALRSLREGVDTSTPTGRAVVSIMATVAELEAELGRERRAASREARVARGLPATCPPKLGPDQAARLVRLYEGGEPADELASMFGVSRRTVFRVLARQRDGGAAG